MIAYIKDDVLNDNKSFIQAVCIKYDGKYEPIEFLSLSSYNQSVNETKPTMSKIKSVDNYLCKWQKLKEWLEKDIEKNHKENEQTDLSVFLHYIAVEQCILQKMQELSEEE